MTVKDKQGRTALDLGKITGDKKMIQLIKNALKKKGEEPEADFLGRLKYARELSPVIYQDQLAQNAVPCPLPGKA